MKKAIAIVISLIMISVICISLFGCNSANYSASQITPNVKEPTFVKSEAEVLNNENNKSALMDFSLNLFGKIDKSDNVCISPLSVYLALAILSAGANNRTMTQLAEVMNLDESELKEYCSYIFRLYQDNESNAETVKIANSVWFTDSFAPKQSFVDDAFNYFDAEIFKTKFDDSTVAQTNKWVDDKTNGMIKKIVEEYSETTIMQIINALVFENDWAGELSDVYIGFTSANSSSKTVDGGYKEIYSYFESENAEAIKYAFKNKRFGFVAILPNGNIDDYLADFDKAELTALLNNENTDYDKVKTYIPYFNHDYDVELKNILANMGMPDAFDPLNADFSNAWDITVDRNVYVSTVKHKTHFELSRTGVRAAAVTMIGEDCTSAPSKDSKIKFIRFDRPFIYMITDNEYGIPLFIGTVKTL